jgi:hypothetical protein
LFCFTSCFTGSSALGMVCIAWLRASLVLHYWAWFVLFHFMLDWLFITGQGMCCSTQCFNGSSLLGMVCIVSLHVSLAHHRWAWFVLFDYALHWFFITGYGL